MASFPALPKTQVILSEVKNSSSKWLNIGHRPSSCISIFDRKFYIRSRFLKLEHFVQLKKLNQTVAEFILILNKYKAKNSACDFLQTTKLRIQALFTWVTRPSLAQAQNEYMTSVLNALWVILMAPVCSLQSKNGGWHILAAISELQAKMTRWRSRFRWLVIRLFNSRTIVEFSQSLSQKE